jgi:flagellar biosynthesis/type III secretory pathway protein FliH
MEHAPKSSNERLRHDISAELSAELEQLEHARPRPEQHAEQAAAEQYERAEAAREVIQQQAEQESAQAEQAPAPAAKQPTRLDLARSYRDTMTSMQRRLGPTSRRFSRVVHQPAIEQASEVVGTTIVRPSVALGATLTALIVGGFLYLYAGMYGFTLSGSEFVLSLVVGGVLGLLLEGLMRLWRRLTRRS